MTSSLGEADITLTSSRSVGKFRVLRLYADAALYPRLGIDLGCSLYHITEHLRHTEQPLVDYELRHLGGELRLAETGAAIGSVHWAGHRRYVRSSAFPSENQLKLTCDLDRWRLERIETARAGGLLTLWIELWPTLVAGDRFLDADARAFQLKVPRDTWLEFLVRARSDADAIYEVFEVRYDRSWGEAFETAFGYIHAARARLDSGNYDSAVGECRKVIETLQQVIGVAAGQDSWKAVLSQHRHERYAEQYARIISAIKQLSAFSHHDLGGSPPNYVRAEAQFVVRTALNVVALVGELASVEAVEPGAIR